MELAPPSIRTVSVGVAYHVGALVSSASATIEATIGERFPLPPTKSGVKRYEYGKVMCIFLGCVSIRHCLFFFFAICWGGTQELITDAGLRLQHHSHRRWTRKARA